MLDQLGEILPQHLNMINNLTTLNNCKKVCKTIVRRMEESESDIVIFRIAATYITSTKIFYYVPED